MPDETTQPITQIGDRPEASPLWPLLLALAAVAERVALEEGSQGADDDLADAA